MYLSDPNHPDSEELRQLFQRLRASAISAFAHAEFAMGDLLQAHISATGSGERFPFTVDTRLKNFRSICLEYANDEKIIELIEWAISGFEATIGDRHALAHGSAELHAEERKVRVLRFSPTKQNDAQITEHMFDLNTMEAKVRTFDEVCRNIIALSRSLGMTLGYTKDDREGWAVEIMETG